MKTSELVGEAGTPKENGIFKTKTKCNGVADKGNFKSFKLNKRVFNRRTLSYFLLASAAFLYLWYQISAFFQSKSECC